MWPVRGLATSPLSASVTFCSIALYKASSQSSISSRGTLSSSHKSPMYDSMASMSDSKKDRSFKASA
ncbi:unnamed protein product [Ectocarpus sp. CCAP 1310/34]|nr:unnamed protein product [Ectocarpus sp. CCAP 1310/34]